MSTNRLDSALNAAPETGLGQGITQMHVLEAEKRSDALTAIAAMHETVHASRPADSYITYEEYVQDLTKRPFILYCRTKEEQYQTRELFELLHTFLIDLSANPALLYIVNLTTEEHIDSIHNFLHMCLDILRLHSEKDGERIYAVLPVFQDMELAPTLRECAKLMALIESSHILPVIFKRTLARLTPPSSETN